MTPDLTTGRQRESSARIIKWDEKEKKEIEKEKKEKMSY